MFGVQRRIQIVREILTHPANRGQRAQALLRSGLFEVSKRLGGWSWTIDLPAEGRLVIPPWSGNGTKFLRASGRADWHELSFCEKYLRPGDVCVDAGANIGAYAVTFGMLVGAGGAVYAFEPVPRLLEALRRNVELNRLDQVRIHALALSDRSGRALMADRDTASAVDESGGVAVLTRRLDDIAPLREAEVALLKLDVEGHEASVLRGAEQLLQREAIAVLLFEVGHDSEANCRTYEILQRAGFRFARFDADRDRLESAVPPRAAPSNTRVGHNLWAIHEAAWHSVRARLGQPL